MSSDNEHPKRRDFMSNIWGWKWSFVSLAIICFFLGLATCRYCVLKPDRLINPEGVEEDF